MSIRDLSSDEQWVLQLFCLCISYFTQCFLHLVPKISEDTLITLYFPIIAKNDDTYVYCKQEHKEFDNI